MLVEFILWNSSVKEGAFREIKHYLTTINETSSKSSNPLTCVLSAVVPPTLKRLSISLSSFTFIMELIVSRSEERRVGKECRSRWARYHYKKKIEIRCGVHEPVLEGE